MQGLRWMVVMCGAQALLTGGAARADGPATDLIVNGDFSNGLQGWTAREFGGGSAPGAVSVDALGVAFDEGDSFLVQLEQRVVVAAGTRACWFTFSQAAAFDRQASFIPDAFEVSLLDARRSPVVAAWKAGATAFFDLQEGGAVHLGPGTTFDGATVVVSTAGVPPGTEIDVVFSLIGGDADDGSRVMISAVGCQVEAAGGDVAEVEGSVESAGAEPVEVEAEAEAEPMETEAAEAEAEPAETQAVDAEAEAEAEAPEAASVDATDADANQPPDVSEPADTTLSAEPARAGAEGCGCAGGADPATVGWMAGLGLCLMARVRRAPRARAQVETESETEVVTTSAA